MLRQAWDKRRSFTASLFAAALIAVSVLWVETLESPSYKDTASAAKQAAPALHPIISWPYQHKGSTIEETKNYNSAAEAIQRQREAELSPPPEPATQPVESTNCQQQKCIALTFDDGPGPHTERLLDYLNQHKVKATFFVLGLYVNKHPHIVQRIAKEGHQLGNHTWHHRDLTRMPLSDVTTEIGSTNQAILQASGVVPHIMRPPFGASNADIIATSTMPQVLWSIDPVDWRDRDAQIIADRIVSAAQRGAIVLAHDVYPSTVDAMPSVIERLKAQGYVFATIDELLNQGQPPAPGEYHKQQL